MGSRWGDGVACSVCKMKYADLRTGETFASIRSSIGDGKYKRLYSVLGTWHEHKLAMWNEHADRCWTYSGNTGPSPDRVAKPLPVSPSSARARAPGGRRVAPEAPGCPVTARKRARGSSGRGSPGRPATREPVAA
jgi:hypothetical protein